RQTRFSRDWSSDVCSSDLSGGLQYLAQGLGRLHPPAPGLDDQHARAEIGVGGGRLGFHLGDDGAGQATTTGAGGGVLEGQSQLRSEERRVGTECRAIGWE